ncbi:MAG: hypothetical protein KBT03_04135 [Bacteroidales bacterium]|nr:hypothetical protein [Candidatus Scybalousia scybalohippi]
MTKGELIYQLAIWAKKYGQDIDLYDWDEVEDYEARRELRELLDKYDSVLINVDNQLIIKERNKKLLGYEKQGDDIIVHLGE